MTSKIYTNFQDIPLFTRWNNYVITVWWSHVEEWLQDQHKHVGVELDPDFQRGHVWSKTQQIAYVEHCLRGGRSTNMLHWNCHDWSALSGKYPLVLVDGKQRLEAVRSFLRSEIPAFGTLYRDYGGFLRTSSGAIFQIHVNDLKTRVEVLQWYLELNAGGVVHTDEELEKVRELLKKEKK